MKQESPSIFRLPPFSLSYYLVSISTGAKRQKNKKKKVGLNVTSEQVWNASFLASISYAATTGTFTLLSFFIFRPSLMN